MSTSVFMFCNDDAFINTQTPFISQYNTGGVAHLTQKGESYFVTLYTESDTRAPTSRIVAWAATRPSHLLVDASFYQQYINDLSASPVSYQQSLFAIIDRLLFNSTATGSTETFLTSDPTAKVAYVPASFVVSSSNVTDTVYSTAVPTGAPFNCPAFVKFSIVVPTGTTTTQYDITIYANDATWVQDYPNSTIQVVVPPVDYQDLLTASLSTTLVNLFAATSASALLDVMTLSPSLDATTSSGYIAYRTTVIDTTGITTVAPFKVLYKGAVPSQLAIRLAVKNAVLTSGVGTAALWQARIPGLFVSSRYYLIPFWDLTLTTQSSQIFTDILKLSTLLSKVDTVLSILNQGAIQSTIELLPTAYNRIILGSVPDTSVTTTTVPLSSLYPSYQYYATTDPNFSYMSADTQAFVQTLTTVLAVATGNAPSTTYLPITDRTLEYLSFTQGEVEFCVITKNGYARALSEAA